MRNIILALLIFSGLTALYASETDYRFCADQPVSAICPNGGCLVTGEGCGYSGSTDGFSAYQLAVAYGFEGSEVEWLNSLKGADGADGADGVDVTSKQYTAAYQQVIAEYRKIREYAEDVAAGSMAVNAIDFGTTAKGVTELGGGVGVSHSYGGSSWAVGVGAKHGITDTEAVIVKGWLVNSSSYSVGAAVTTRF